MQDFVACKVPLFAGAEPMLIALKKEIRKTVMVMKVAAILLLASLQVSAKGWGQEKINLSFNNASLEQVFSAITAQTNIAFLYRPQYVKGKTVSINITNASLKTVLELCLKGQQLSYEIIGKNVAIRPEKKYSEKAVSSIEVGNGNSPFIDVRGRVLNEKGDPVEGVTVAVKGSSKNTMTDKNGEFSLATVEQNAILVFTHVSMESFEFRVSGKTELVINLKAKVSALGDVLVTVNTGYQKISKERFVGSYGQIDSVRFHLRPGTNIIDRIDGLAPGILFNNKDGNYPIQIRGLSTLGIEGTSTQPLIILDNFPLPNGFDINKINPNDVENITILKDAAAASIWGARAGNGVIVITTKKGSFNQKLRMTFSSNITVEEKPDLFSVPRVSPSDFIDIEQYLFDNGFYSGKLTDQNTWPVVSGAIEIMDRKANGLISDQDATTQLNSFRQYDVRNELNNKIYRPAIKKQHFLNLSGGSQSLVYQLSLGYNKNLNNVQGSKSDDQYTVNSNVIFKPAPFIELESGLNYVQENIRRVEVPSLDPLSPYTRFTDDDGVPLPIPYKYRPGYIDTAGVGVLQDWHYRPIDEIRNTDNRSFSTNVRLNFGTVLNFTNWLKGKVSYQYFAGNISSKNYQSLETFATRDLINHFTNPFQTNPSLRYPVPVGGIMLVTNTRINSYNFRGSLNVNKTFNDHEINAMVAAEVSDTKGFANTQTIYGYNDINGSSRPNIDYFNYYPVNYADYPGAVGLIPNNNGIGETPVTRFVSLLANAGYTYKSKYYLFMTTRRDGANLFGVNTNNKWKPLWSVGGAWEISKERFFNISWLPYLKVRSSFGYLGNVNNVLYGKLVITNSASPARFTNLPMSTIGVAANPDLKWEEIRTINTGLDFRLFNDKISGTFEVYKKNSADVISNQRLAPSTGIFTYPLNSSTLRINGFDLQLTSGNIKFKGVSITNTIGLSYAKTTVTKFTTVVRNKAQDFIFYAFNATAGQMLYGLSSFKWGGLDPANGDPQGILNGNVSKNYEAIFNDSIGNQVFHGSSLPLYSSFLTTNLSFKGITLTFNITGKFNYYFREPAQSLMYSENWGANNYLADYYKRWQKAGDENFTTVPSMTYPDPANSFYRNDFYQFSSIHVKRADNIRLQFINLSYQFGDNRHKYLPFQNVRLFFYVNNLNIVLWRATKSPYDPEYNSIGSLGFEGPSPKTWNGGVTINF